MRTARQASANFSSPCGSPISAFDGVKNTGPNTAKSAPSFSALFTSATL